MKILVEQKYINVLNNETTERHYLVNLSPNYQHLMKYLFILLFSFPLIIQAQTKSYQIKRAEIKPTTDGKITTKEWVKHDLAEEFISYYPISGAAMPKGFKTEWKATYDNQSIYFAVYMYDPRPESIMRQLC